MKNCLLLFSGIMLALVGCQKDETGDTPQTTENDQVIIIQERDPDIPLILTYPNARPETRSLDPLTFTQCLGRSFKTDSYPLETMENLGPIVIDATKVMERFPTLVYRTSLRNFNSSSFAYAGFDRYTANSNITKKISSGFNLNFGMFSIGNKKTITRTFSSSITNNYEAVFGQLDIEYRSDKYSLDINSSLVNQYWRYAIDPAFTRALYYMMPAEVYDFYGGFVLSKMITGGRASALYSGLAVRDSMATAEGKEKNMKTNINASFKGGTNFDGEFGFGSGYSNTAVFSDNIDEFQTSIVTLGGSLGTSGATVANSIDNFSLNLSPWINSLNNENYHQMIDIPDDGGLVPLSVLFMEENLKEHFKEFYRLGDQNTASWTFTEPELIIYTGFIAYPAIFLRTRYNDIVRLYTHDYNFIDDHFDNMVLRFKDVIFRGIRTVEYQSYGGRIPEVLIGAFDLNVSFYERPHQHQVHTPFTAYFMWAKVTNEMTYLLYKYNNVRIGFAVYSPPEALRPIFDCYGRLFDFAWRDCSQAPIYSIDDLRAFKLIAL